MKRGFSLLEILLVLGILTLIAGISMASFLNMKNAQTLDRDADVIAEVLRQARSQTLTSLNDINYGVHFSSKQITLFAGGVYNPSASNNKVFNLNTTVAVSLTGGGSDMVFNRLSGETAQNGTITISSSSGKNRIISVHKTGLIELQ